MVYTGGYRTIDAVSFSKCAQSSMHRYSFFTVDIHASVRVFNGNCAADAQTVAAMNSRVLSLSLAGMHAASAQYKDDECKSFEASYLSVVVSL